MPITRFENPGASLASVECVTCVKKNSWLKKNSLTRLSGSIDGVVASMEGHNKRFPDHKIVYYESDRSHPVPKSTVLALRERGVQIPEALSLKTETKPRRVLKYFR